MSASLEELRRILSEHVPPQYRERAMVLLEAVVSEARRGGSSPPLEPQPGNLGSAGGQFPRWNGEIAGPGLSAFAGDSLGSGNGVLGWPSAPGRSAWGNAAGLSDIPIGSAGTGGAWGAGGFNSNSSWSFGSNAIAGSLESEEAAVLQGLSLDGPAPAAPGSGRLSSGFSFGSANPVTTFELQDPAADSRILGPSMLLNSTSAQSESTSTSATEQPAEPTQSQPAPAAKFSSVVGGSGRTQGTTPAATPTPAAPADDASKRALDTQPRQEPTRVDASKRHDAPRPATKVDSKRQEPKRIDAAGMGSKSGTISKVKLRGLPYGATMADVVNFFRGFGVVENSITFGVNSDGRPSGEAWVSFNRLEDARRAVREKDRHHMGDRYVELFLLNEGGGVASRGSGFK